MEGDVQACPRLESFFRKKEVGLARCPRCPTFSLLFFSLTLHTHSTHTHITLTSHSHISFQKKEVLDILDILDISKLLRPFCERREENLDMLGHMPSNSFFRRKAKEAKSSKIKREVFFHQTLLSFVLFAKGRF